MSQDSPAVHSYFGRSARARSRALGVFSVNRLIALILGATIAVFVGVETRNVYLRHIGICPVDMRRFSKEEMITAGIKAALEYSTAVDEIDPVYAATYLKAHPECCIAGRSINAPQISTSLFLSPVVRVDVYDVPYGYEPQRPGDFTIWVDTCGKAVQIDRL